MAYAAVVSLVQILKQLLHSDQFPKPERIQSLHDHVSSLQSSLEIIIPAPQSSRDEVYDLEIQIRDALYKAQDTVESFLPTPLLFLQKLQKLVAEIGPITKTAEEMANSIRRTKEDTQTGNNSSSPGSASSSKISNIVGQEKDLQELRDLLTREIPQKLQVIPITGTAGIGKTTLAKSIYEDGLIRHHFNTRAWVTVSSDNHVKDILLKLLGSLESMGQIGDVSGSMEKLGNKVSQEISDGQLEVQLHQRLFDTTYLIVIDDMWNKNVWDKIKKSFPDNNKGSRIVLTTRIPEIADHAKSSNFRHEMRPLNGENSWKLLCEEVFGGGTCPPELEDSGRNIAEKCGGLPLLITVVGGQLFKERKTKDYWKTVAAEINAATATSKEPHLEILSLSYSYLPGRLKGCFLYMGAFPEDSEISVSKLIKLWVAEGFLIPPSVPSESLEQVGKQYLKDLIDRNLIFVRKISSHDQIKTCGMHDSLRNLAMEESKKQKFFHSINRYVQVPSEGTDHRLRRLSVHKNSLMCVEDVYNSTKSVTFARTLLYVGPHHHHPLPFCLTFELLRVLDALTVYFIKFPNEIIKLIHLRYLSFTYNGKIPPSISKLRNLQTLIVRQNPKIIYCGTSILPVEIWNMPELRHLLFTESDLPPFIPSCDHAENSVLLVNLQTLSNVGAASCTNEVLQNIPNLKKLGIWIDEAPGEVNFDPDVLQQLEALKFTVLNPKIPESKIDLDSPPTLISLPTMLKKLTLSGCGIPWEDMTVIGELPYLEVLKLREFAFYGPEWCPNKEEFRKLKFLLLESMDLENWDADRSHFPSLKRLIVRHCYELEKIPADIGNIEGLELIELVDCSPLAVASAKTIRDQQKDSKTGPQVLIYSSRE